jgi:hypothetical protein
MERGFCVIMFASSSPPVHLLAHMPVRIVCLQPGSESRLSLGTVLFPYLLTRRLHSILLEEDISNIKVFMMLICK